MNDLLLCFRFQFQGQHFIGTKRTKVRKKMTLHTTKTHINTHKKYI